ncbi:MAG: hypothetical protein E6144_04455 [Finegoldia magna]|nr:hypothetical protein [Finegoldia magna]
MIKIKEIIEINNTEIIMGLFGNFDKNRKYIENRFDVKIKTENGNISLNGEEVNLNLVKKLIEEYDVKTTTDIQYMLKDLFTNTIHQIFTLSNFNGLNIIY